MTLAELRNKKKLTQEQAAKMLEINKKYLSMLENGNKNPSDKLKLKMSKIYGVSATQIFLAVQTTKSRIESEE